MSENTGPVVADIVERAAWTAGQQAFAILLTTGAATKVGDLPWELALATAAGAAIVSVLTSIAQRAAQLTDLDYWPDLGARLLKTFIAAFLGVVGANFFNVLDFDWENAANIAALATLAALAKGFLARNEPGEGEAARSNPSTLRPEIYERSIESQTELADGLQESQADGSAPDLG